MTASQFPTQPGGFEWYMASVEPGDLFADPAYQRDLDQRRVKSMAATFDHRLLGVLEVSARADGRYAILDGQHRHAVVLLAAPGRSLVCQVYEGLSIEAEARLFHEINMRRKTLSWWDKWKARRAAGDELVQSIEAVLADHGCRVHTAQQDGNIRATKALETIVEEIGDLTMLDSVITVVLAAFGRSVDAFDGALMQGIAYMLANYDPDELDVDRLVRALTDVPPRQIRARAASLREFERGTLPRLCGAVMVDIYNRSRGRTVESFLSRVPQLAKADRRSTTNRNERRHRVTVTEQPAAAVGEPGPAPRTSPAPVQQQPSPPPAGPVPTHPMLAMCACGHTQRRHEDQAGMCLVAQGCECARFDPVGEK